MLLATWLLLPPVSRFSCKLLLLHFHGTKCARTVVPVLASVQALHLSRGSKRHCCRGVGCTVAWVETIKLSFAIVCPASLSCGPWGQPIGYRGAVHGGLLVSRFLELSSSSTSFPAPGALHAQRISGALPEARGPRHPVVAQVQLQRVNSSFCTMVTLLS